MYGMRPKQDSQRKSKPSSRIAFPRGSEWRRWDLHLHSPGTAISDNFAGWKTYLDSIEKASPQISVAGITDYLSIRTYAATMKHKTEGRLKKVDLLLPNIEFRISPRTHRGKGINLHLLVDPSDPSHIKRIEEGLSRLKIEFHNEDIPCTEDGLIRLGKLHDPALGEEDSAAYRAGVGQFKLGFNEFRDWHKKEEWLSRNSLILVEAGSMDGTSGLSKNEGYTATREEIQRFADIILSPNRKDREYWLGQGADKADVLEAKYGGPKPCVCGSDAHDEESIHPNTLCWIKADPTFEGLRQVLYEPSERIHFGQVAPRRHNEDLVIDSLSIDDPNGWFQTREIELNPGLVTIIGPRGSGKTALSDFLAFASASSLDAKDGFLARASDELDGLEVTMTWSNGRQSSALVGRDSFVPQDAGEVRYLSQKFVEQLCSTSSGGDQLTEELERVVFQSIPEEDRLGTDSLRELRSIRTNPLADEREAIQRRISDLNQAIAELIGRISKKDRLERKLIELDRKIAAITKQLPRTDNKEETGRLERLEKLQQAHQELAERIEAEKKRQQDLKALRLKATRLAEEFQREWRDILQRVKRLGVTEQAIPSVEGVSTLQEAIDKTLLQSQKDVTKIQGNLEDPRPKTLAKVKIDIADLEKKLKLDTQNQKKLKTLQEQITRTRKDRKSYARELQAIKTTLPAERKEKTTQRAKDYAAYFDLLDSETQVLHELYGYLQARLNAEGAGDEKKLELYIRRSIDLAGWIRRGESLFDRRTGPFREPGKLRKIVDQNLLAGWRSGDHALLQQGIADLIEEVKDSVTADTAQLRQDVRQEDVAAWLFSVDHISLNYAIRYGGVELEKLSPGTKGIVLLIIYLILDQEDLRPLLIDQPEENLDNRSVYSLLLQYFRTAKARRQIILITHNPNLVVNTDAEQVIVANRDAGKNGLPLISYQYGALEAVDAGNHEVCPIREATIDILEGGRRAFELREKKYSARLGWRVKPK